MDHVTEEIESLQAVFGHELTVENKGESLMVVYHHSPTVSISITISSGYPDVLPVIEVPSHLKGLGLLDQLVAVATPLKGTPMLYAMVDHCKEWLNGHSLSLETSNTPTTTSTATVSGSVICKFYLQGKCSFGNRCKNIHPSSGATPSSSPSKKPETRTKKSETQTTPTKQQNQSDSKQTSPEDDEKKEKMRTATEVISRIQWDPELPTDQFTIGYLDRFTGIQEKPFTEFNWEDLATLGPNVLAVPKHRIQYFKYKDVIVWDKRVQLDNVFGSRGGSTIDEIVTKMGGAPEEEKEKEIVMDDEDETEEKRYYSDVNRPTHFLCIHVNDKEVVSEVKKVITHITSLNPQLSDCLINTSSLHITLCMMRLANDDQIATAVRVFQQSALEFLSLLPSCTRLVVEGVDNFRERLIYIKIKPEPSLSKFVAHMIERFQEAGLKTPGNHDEYTPHITIVKLSRPKQREMDLNVITPACYRPFSHTSFGHQPVTSVHLCSMHAPAQEDGFYLRHSTITNSLIHLPPSFSSTLLPNQIMLLSDSGYMETADKERLMDELTCSVNENDEEKFDDVIEEVTRINKEANTFESFSSIQPSVVIMRGLPGSGKSHLVSHSAEYLSNPSQTAIISADDYFIDDSSRYRFDSSSAHKAHLSCLVKFLTSLANGARLVIIDNTNTQQWEYTIYTYICDILGYQYYILEIPCIGQLMCETYLHRNLHNIQLPAMNKMHQRWEEDHRGVVAPPTVAYPCDWKGLSSYSLLSLCRDPPVPPQITEAPSLTAVYTGIFLTRLSQWKLLSACRPSHSELYGSHVTLTFKPTMEQLGDVPIGKKVMLKVTGQSDNGRIQAAIVELPRTVSSDNKTAHVTVSAILGVAPKMANVMLQAQLIRMSQQVTLEGVVGVVIRQATEGEKKGNEEIDEEETSILTQYTLTSASIYQSLKPKILFKEEEGVASKGCGIITGEPPITQLYVFDFDGTLFVPPGNYQGRQDYQRLTGKKWPRKGWLGWAESLLPPLQTSPGPALSHYRSHFGRAGSHTVVLTGRVENCRSGVKYVLEKSQLFPDKLICKPDMTDETTSSFKTRVVKELLSFLPDVNVVKFWDDIPANLTAIDALSRLKKYSSIQFDIIDATRLSDSHPTIRSIEPVMPHIGKKYGSFLEGHLYQYGLLPTADYQRAVNEGLDLILGRFARLVHYNGDPRNLSFVFGSHPLNRVSDIDVCLVAPPTMNHAQWITSLATDLETNCGIKHVHVGRSSRCPRLRALIQFPSCPSIEYDIIVTLMDNDKLLKSGSHLSLSDVVKYRDSGDAVSRVSINGPIFMERVRSVCEKVGVNMEVVGAIVEVTVQLLMAKREKGNAYHCLRTFHMVKLLIDFLETYDGFVDCDKLFKDFIGHASTLSPDDWSILCEDFVPMEYFPRLMSVFQQVTGALSDSSFPCSKIYEDLMTRPQFPADSYTPVQIHLSGPSDVLVWKASVVVEARLPTYIRQLLTQGIDVVTDGNSRNKTSFSFAVPKMKSSKEKLQKTLRPFWNEISDMKKKGNLSVQLTFDQPLVVSSSKVTDPKMVPVLESIQSFGSSSDDELHLSPSLTAKERMVAHEMAERCGLKHSSVGSGKNRHIVLRK